MLERIKNILNYELLNLDSHIFLIKDVLVIIVVLIIAPLLFWAINKFILKQFFERRKYNIGRRFAVTSIVKYLYYLLFFLITVDLIGVKMSVLLGAGAALLVGIGLGLQQTFNDFASGIILLIEGTVSKGDWIQVEDLEGEVIAIGMRTSHIITRRNVTVIVPNSKIVVDNVINFTHNSKKVRYDVKIGVAYGSDVKKVKSLLITCAERHNLIMKKPAPFVRFKDFGDSALMFELLFWCEDYYNLEDVRSDIRFMIDSEFRTANIRIPFPQRDVHMIPMNEVSEDKDVN